MNRVVVELDKLGNQIVMTVSNGDLHERRVFPNHGKLRDGTALGDHLLDMLDKCLLCGHYDYRVSE